MSAELERCVNKRILERDVVLIERIGDITTLYLRTGVKISIRTDKCIVVSFGLKVLFSS